MAHNVVLVEEVAAPGDGIDVSWLLPTSGSHSRSVTPFSAGRRPAARHPCHSGRALCTEPGAWSRNRLRKTIADSPWSSGFKLLKQ